MTLNVTSGILCDVRSKHLGLQLASRNERCGMGLTIPVHNSAWNEIRSIDGERERSAARDNGGGSHRSKIWHRVLGKGTACD